MKRKIIRILLIIMPIVLIFLMYTIFHYKAKSGTTRIYELSVIGKTYDEIVEYYGEPNRCYVHEANGNLPYYKMMVYIRSRFSMPVLNFKLGFRNLDIEFDIYLDENGKAYYMQYGYQRGG